MTGNYTVSYIVLIALALVALILLLRMDDTCVGRTTIAK
jgi:hypothetical protein